MSTSVTPDAFLASLNKWGVKWRFYKDRADWLAHNRNFKNTDITPGGFGPLYGVVAHNTASTAQAGMIDYLYRGDAARNLPGPLAHIGILKTGEGVLLGWGTTNHAGPSDPRALKAAKANTAPMTSEIRPVTDGPSDPDAVRVAPYFLGFEACYSSEGPTPEQYRAMVLFTCACLDVMGGPANGYGAGSVLMHREMTTTRSDPQGVTRDGEFRRDVAAQLKAGPPTATTSDPTPNTEDIMATIAELETSLRKVLAEEATAAALFAGHNIVKDTRTGVTDDSLPRVTPSTLLEAAAAPVHVELDPAAVAAAIPDGIAQAVADELAKRLRPVPA